MITQMFDLLPGATKTSDADYERLCFEKVLDVDSEVNGSLL